MADSDPHRERYEQLVHAHAPELYRYAYRLTGRHDLAEDLLQETFVEAWKSMARLKEPARARGWLFQILRFRRSHLLRDSKHLQNVQPLTDNASEASIAKQRTPVDALAEQDELQTALNTLPVAARETFLMVFSQGLTCRETAEALKIPLGTVLSRLDSARRAMRATLTRKSEVSAMVLPRPQTQSKSKREADSV